MIEYYRQKKRARNYFKAKKIEQRNMEGLHNNSICLLHLMIPSTSCMQSTAPKEEEYVSVLQAGATQ
ncbi:unnamed protein product, partial [Musa hybrid cultivar]